MYNPFRVINTQDPEEGGEPIGTIDVEDRSLEIGLKQPIKFIGANYTVVPEDTGSLLVVTAAATITLPAVSAALRGVYVEIFVKADVTVVVASTANEMITFNDVDADQITWSTSSEKVGAAVKAVCDGLSWLVMLFTEETQTTSVTT